MEALTAAQEGMYHIVGDVVQEKLLQIFRIDYKSLFSLQTFDIGNHTVHCQWYVVPMSTMAAVCEGS